MTTIRQWLFNRNVWAYGLFWSWNVIFLAFLLLGFAPTMLPALISAVQADEVPAIFLITAAIVPLIPVVVVILGATVFRRAPGRLFALGYGIEGPLMLVLAIRLFAVRELTVVVAVLLVIALLGLFTYFGDLWDTRPEARGAWLNSLRVVGLTLLVLTGLYVGVWAAFYAFPFAVLAVRGFSEFLAEMPRMFTAFWEEVFKGRIFLALFGFLGMTLFLYSATLFMILPLAIPMLYLRAWWRGFKTLAAQRGAGLASGLALMACVVSLATVALTVRQPQQAAFNLLAQKPQNIEAARSLAAQEDNLRAGLLNAFLAQFRYLGSVTEMNHIREIYREIGWGPEVTEQVQAAYEWVARPVLYEPVPELTGDRWAFSRDSQEAAKLYAQFFDQPIVDGERLSVINAVRSTWSPDQARAAWQAVDDREVRLLRQEINFTEHGDWAEFELYEVYQNQTTARQEVVYYFSLPETAVITGVWLGNSADRADRFEYRVAPRGAAQAVYQSQVRVNLDPALVEQIGPRQYRLRVFPIEPERVDYEYEGVLIPTTTRTAGAEMHLWLTWRVLAANNAWPMPNLAEKFNVYWDTGTERLFNGQTLNLPAEAWLPANLAASGNTAAQAHRVDFSNGQSVVVRPLQPGEVLQPPATLRLAVVLDRSRSMVARAAEVEQALTALRTYNLQPEMYLTASDFRGEAPSRAPLARVQAPDLFYFGGQNPAQLLQQFEQMRGEAAYDAVLVLTDDSGYELGPSTAPVPVINAPVWMVHLGGEYPLGYDDATLEAIQASGGGVAGSVEEALTRLMAARAGVQGARADVVDGYVWQTLPTGLATPASDETFAPLAARQLILATLPNPHAVADRLEVLDGLHKIAMQNGIVTPYSSMIVLVNAEQHRMLDDLENDADRFEREFEEVGETEPLNVTGVPEPEEWLLMGLAAVALAAWYWRQRRLATPAGRLG
ncbi:MAG: TIGR02921 family PEP-CTERM protein [Anaerolineales bacterium]|nr:TIGR02921 family PEP-CTERM protein [Anaerolineales bacterium]